MSVKSPVVPESPQLCGSEEVCCADVCRMRPDPHDIECARAAYALLIERAKTHAEKRKLKKELLEYERKQ